MQIFLAPRRQTPGIRPSWTTTDDFGQLMPANYMKVHENADPVSMQMLLTLLPAKWMYTEPKHGLLNFTSADCFVALADADWQFVRCQDLMWYNELPP